ncbi:MAG TPA: hypothetical protein VFZ73_19330 [Gemmatimonadaceae bacterium]
MTARRGLPRVLATVLLGLQALLWGGGSILEARTAAESLMRYSHVEDQATRACPPIHSHLDCVICRTFGGGAAGGDAPTVVAIAYRESQPRVQTSVLRLEREWSGVLTRGPPARSSVPA